MKTKIYITLLTILFTVNTFDQSKVEEIKMASKELNQSTTLAIIHYYILKHINK